MTVVRPACLVTRRPMRALGADRRGGFGLDYAVMLTAAVVSAMQVAALMGSTLQQTFAPVIAAIAALNGN